jgi:hypothetical protein
MAPTTPHKPRLFIDADVLFSGAVAPAEHSASLVILRLAEITLIEAIASEQVIVETERNLVIKFPAALPAFHLLVQRCLRIVPSPLPQELLPYRGLADEKDLPILVAALQNKSAWLVSFNVRHFQPGHPDVKVLRPGEVLLRVRELLSGLPGRD